MTLLFVTSNKHKFDAVSEILGEFELEIKRGEMDFIEFPSQTIKEIAVHKARQAFAEYRVPLIVEDTGVFFEAYNNFPGPEAKRAFEALGFEGLLKLLGGKSRAATLRTVFCFMERSDSFKTFEGEWKGKISKKVVKPNANVLPYEKIFIPEKSKKAVVELPKEEKNQLSHRAVAARKLGEWLKEKAIDDLIDSI
jgi:non-canonical purine NTP pyrophosphatase (RdgB/HAM1 family)